MSLIIHNTFVLNDMIVNGGEGEIRTPGTLSGSSAFEAGAFNHSATSPRQIPAYQPVLLV